MRRFPLWLTTVFLLVLAFALNASAALTPTVTAVRPVSALNDVDAVITVSGGGFAAGVDGTATVFLSGRELSDVTRVSDATLTATVPWGLDAGPYQLTVRNPDGAVSAPMAFTVGQGIGSWNTGDLFGAGVTQLLMKPDSDTLYAMTFDVGMFRSENAGGDWAFVGDGSRFVGNADLVLDPAQPDGLYCYQRDGLRRSTDGGDSWPVLLRDTSRDEHPRQAEVFVSPQNPDLLFLGSYVPAGTEDQGSVKGLIRSEDRGATWGPVASMDGTSVQSIAFDPKPGSLEMVLATSDARVFTSADAGKTWSAVAKPPVSGLFDNGLIAYNPFAPGEVWVTANGSARKLFRSTGADLTDWSEVSPTGYGGSPVISFPATDSVYVARFRSANNGTTWDAFGPDDGHTVLVSPDDTRTVFVGTTTDGVERTTDDGATWTVQNRGLRGMRCVSMTVSSTDPLTVYAAFNGWPGLHRSDDGATTWRYLPISGAGQVWRVCEDPHDSQRLFVASDGGFFQSTDGGEHWDARGWNDIPDDHRGMAVALAADPSVPGHLLVGMAGPSEGWVYRSDDYGLSWDAVSLPNSIAPARDIIFDPLDAGKAYLSTMGTGLYKTFNSGGNWVRTDDLAQTEMREARSITIATHPEHVVVVHAGASSAFRSTDGGVTWQRRAGPGEDAGTPSNGLAFIDKDSTQLYALTWAGLYRSADGGASWTRAAGALGSVQVTALGSADANGHTILYAATTGGSPGAPVAGTSAPMTIAAADPTLVGAGVYRYAQIAVPAPPAPAPTALARPSVSPSKPRHKKTVTFRSTLYPAAAAASAASTLSLYRYEHKKIRKKVHGKWRRVQVHYWRLRRTYTMSADAAGGLRARVKVPYAGKWRMQVSYAGSTAYAPCVSATKKFTVK